MLKKFLSNFSKPENERKVLLAIVLLAVLVRLYRIHYPLGDWHSWRQADTASVTREYVKNGIDLLHPRYHDLSSIPNGLDNSTEGYRMVEFPIVNGVIAAIIRTFPALPLVPTSRFFSIMASMLTLVSIYGLVKVLTGHRQAIVSALIFALLPYSIYYSRVILPEPYLLASSTFSIFAFIKWLKTDDLRWWGSSAIALALAMLLKPFALFLAPVYACLLGIFLVENLSNSSSLRQPEAGPPLEGKQGSSRYNKTGFLVKPGMTLFLKLMGYGVIAFAPFLLWRQWIAQFPEGIPASSWLFNSNGIRFRPAWYRWLGYERLTKLYLGYIGIVFLPLAFLKISQDRLIYFSWWLGILLYFSVIATGNVHHDYYQNLMTPILTITVGIGIVSGYDLFKKYISANLAMAATVSLTALMLILAWQQVKGYFNVNHWEYVEAGQAVDQLTPADAKVIAPTYGGDTHFLFQTNRRGWPFGGDIQEKIDQGATHYVTTTYDDEAKDLKDRYPIIEENATYMILNLTQSAN